MCLNYKRADFESPVWLLRDRLGIQNTSASLNESAIPSLNLKLAGTLKTLLDFPNVNRGDGFFLLASKIFKLF